MSTEDINKLRSAGVSEQMIAYLIRTPDEVRCCCKDAE